MLSKQEQAKVFLPPSILPANWHSSAPIRSSWPHLQASLRFWPRNTMCLCWRTNLTGPETENQQSLFIWPSLISPVACSPCNKTCVPSETVCRLRCWPVVLCRAEPIKLFRWKTLGRETLGWVCQPSLSLRQSPRNQINLLLHCKSAYKRDC